MKYNERIKLDDNESKLVRGLLHQEEGKQARLAILWDVDPSIVSQTVRGTRPISPERGRILFYHLDEAPNLEFLLLPGILQRVSALRGSHIYEIERTLDKLKSQESNNANYDAMDIFYSLPQ